MALKVNIHPQSGYSAQGDFGTKGSHDYSQSETGSAGVENPNDTLDKKFKNPDSFPHHMRERKEYIHDDITPHEFWDNMLPDNIQQDIMYAEQKEYVVNQKGNDITMRIGESNNYTIWISTDDVDEIQKMHDIRKSKQDLKSQLKWMKKKWRGGYNEEGGNILIDVDPEDGGPRAQTVEGHHRLALCKMLGLKWVPVTIWYFAETTYDEDAWHPVQPPAITEVTETPWNMKRLKHAKLDTDGLVGAKSWRVYFGSDIKHTRDNLSDVRTVVELAQKILRFTKDYPKEVALQERFPEALRKIAKRSHEHMEKIVDHVSEHISSGLKMKLLNSEKQFPTYFYKRLADDPDDEVSQLATQILNNAGQQVS